LPCGRDPDLEPHPVERCIDLDHTKRWPAVLTTRPSDGLSDSVGQRTPHSTPARSAPVRPLRGARRVRRSGALVPAHEQRIIHPGRVFPRSRLRPPGQGQAHPYCAETRGPDTRNAGSGPYERVAARTA
jgi:hypothetical protein